MKPDDRPCIDPLITRRQLALAGRWPCCGGWYPGIHRGVCRVVVSEIQTPKAFISEHGMGDSHDLYAAAHLIGTKHSVFPSGDLR